MIDEFQRVPELASHIQALVDEPGFSGTYVLTGSRNLTVRNTASQSLAGRTAVVELLPFSCGEVRHFVGDVRTDELIYPSSKSVTSVPTNPELARKPALEIEHCSELSRAQARSEGRSRLSDRRSIGASNRAEQGRM